MKTNPDRLTEFLELAKRIRAIADISLVYAHDDYERERADELLDISNQLTSDLTGLSPDRISGFYNNVTDYPTPKVDVRAFVMNHQKQVLLVQEKIDSKWSLPGGWADIGKTPAENVLTEVREETGLQVEVRHLLAVFDKRMHPHPPQPFYVYKMFFHCILKAEVERSITPAFDILDVDWFDLDKLPPLSTDRILESQIRLLWDKVNQGNLETVFD